MTFQRKKFFKSTSKIRFVKLEIIERFTMEISGFFLKKGNKTFVPGVINKSSRYIQKSMFHHFSLLIIHTKWHFEWKSKS